MLRRLSRLLLATMFALTLAVTPVAACPLCKDAISTPNPEEEVNNLPRAFNNSILLMVGVPYLSLGIVGFAIYRGVKKNSEYLAELKAQSKQADE